MSLSEDLRPEPRVAPRIPRLPAVLVERPRLYERLDAAAPLTLVHGPGGFGKTTLVAAWLEQRADDARVAWISVPADVDGPAGFWALVARELARAGIPVAEGLGSASAVREALSGSTGPTIVVLDGFDNVAGVEGPLLEAVRASRELRVVLCQRRTVASVDWTLTVDAIEIAPQDLLFTEAESTWLLRALVPEAPPQACAAAHAELGGWPVVVRAAATAGLDLERAFATLRTQVPTALADRAMARFIQQTSIVDEVSVDVALVLTEDKDAAARMNQLIGAGLLQQVGSWDVAGGTPARRRPSRDPGERRARRAPAARSVVRGAG
jgi:LuxR family maltose regulon positive regulatory protein